MLTRALLAATLLVLVCPRHADAQIYAWRDANGTLVLSDRSIDRPTAVYEVEGAPKYVSTTPVESTSARERYEPYVQEYSNRQSLRPELVRAVIQVESGYNPRALSPKGAMGLMQLMPETARMLGVQRPYDPEQNIRGGTRYLRLLLDKYEGNEGKKIPPYRETRDYVRKVGSAAGEAQTSTRKLRIYKTIEILDGRAVPRYSSEKPSSGSFEIISR